MSSHGTRFTRLLLVLVFASFSVVTVVADARWEQAVGIFAANQNWNPGRIETSSREYNGRDRLLNEEHVVTRSTIGTDGEVVSEIVSAIKNGEDITEARRNGDEGPGRFMEGAPEDIETNEAGFRAIMMNPFDPELQAAVVSIPTGRNEWVDGTRAEVYEYTIFVDEENAVHGAAWIDVETNAPVRIRAELPPPMSLVKSFIGDYRYRIEGGRWVITEMRFDVAAQFLLVHRRFEISMVFGDHFLVAGR